MEERVIKRIVDLLELLNDINELAKLRRTATQNISVLVETRHLMKEESKLRREFKILNSEGLQWSGISRLKMHKNQEISIFLEFPYASPEVNLIQSSVFLADIFASTSYYYSVSWEHPESLGGPSIARIVVSIEDLALQRPDLIPQIKESISLRQEEIKSLEGSIEWRHEYCLEEMKRALEKLELIESIC